jgi:CRP/FNR family transcriptional regulator, cyclic AMP receptor protein
MPDARLQHEEHKGRTHMAYGINLAEVQAACGPANIVSLQPGEFLFREGDPAHALYVVKRGLLRVVSGSTIYETLRPGALVGEMGIVEEGSRRSASVIAGLRSELIEIDTARFLALVSEVPDFSLTVMRVMAHRLRVMNQRYRGNP